MHGDRERPPVLSGLWPFIGRDGELERFREALRDPRCTGLLIGGPAGVGKTRLAEECLAAALDADVPVARAVTSRSAAGLPLGALAHLLALPDGRPVPSGSIEASAAADASRLLATTRAAWLDRAGGRRQVVFVDDLDLLDPVSLDLLTRLAADGVVFLLATLRTGATPAGPVPAGIRRADLGELDTAGVDRLLHRALGSPVTAATAASLWRASQGNVLFLRELVAGSVAAGALVVSDGVWRLVDEPGTTPRLDQLIDARLAALPPASRPVLECLAVCQPLEAAALDDLAAPGIVAHLERQGLVRIDVRGRRRTAALAHPLYTQAVRRRTPTLRTERILREQIARVRALGTRRQEDALRLAGWELEVSGTGDPELLLRAARLSCAVHDNAAVERLASAVLAAPAAAAHAATALHLAGSARAELHRPEEGEATFAAATSAVVLPGEGRLLVEIALRRSLNLGLTLGRRAEALAVVDEAVAATPGEDHAELASVAAVLHVHDGRPGRAAELLAGVPAGLARTSPSAATARMDVLCATGRPVQALAEHEAGLLDGLDRLGRAGTSILSHPSYARFSVATALMTAGRLVAAQAEAEAGVQDAAQADVPGAHVRGVLLLGRIHMLRGRSRTAMRYFREATGVARASGRREVLRQGLAGLTALQARQGDVTSARRMLDELAAARTEPAEGFVVLAEAWALVAAGATAKAVDVLRAAAADGAAAGAVTAEAALLHHVARLGFPKLVAERLAELVAVSDSPLIAARAAHTTGLARGDLDLLCAAAEEFERFDALLFAAEAFRAVGQALRATGRSRPAAAATARAAALLERCEGGRSPAALGLDAPVQLSRREREVAVLAAAGTASKEIAASLGLSARTVTNHLQNAYTKLGVSSRAELGRILGGTAG